MRDVLVSGADRDRLRAALEAAGAILVREESSAAATTEPMLRGTIPNDRLSDLVDHLAVVPNATLSFQPVGTIVLTPGSDRLIPSGTRTVPPLSPVEVVVGGFQSVGSWTGFVTTAVASGCIVWAGFYTNIVFLLIGAMLIAPLAAPAMNGALAIALGSAYQLGRALVRFTVAILCGAVAAAALTLAFGMSSTTPLMLAVGTVSDAAIVLPVVAGVVGAITLIQPGRSNLISGAATGILVAAALAPPVGLLGIGTVLQQWDLLTSAAFQLGLQYSVIGLAGGITFAVAGGIGPAAAQRRTGRRARWILFVMATLIVAALLALQTTSDVALHRTAIARDAEAQARRTVRDGDARLVDLAVTFTSEQTEQGDKLLLVRIVVSPPAGAKRDQLDAERLERRLERAVDQRVPEGVTTLADVVVVD